jgi:hypothetical protein
MEFTQYIWRLYAYSERGQEAIAKTAESFLDTASTNDMMWRWPLHRLDSEGEPVQLEDEFVEADLRTVVRSWLREQTVDSDESATSLFTGIVDEGIEMWQEADGERRFYYFGGEGSEEEVYSNIAGVSLALHEVFPEHFLPYLFNRRFDRFSAICDAFTIPIPKPPGKMHKRERALYYTALNQALHEFRRQHLLTPKEMVAFLYDFAPRVIAAEQDAELPAPSRVWFTMGGIGGNGDFEFLDQVNVTSTSIWQGNMDTRRGDMILMWCVSPRSYLHSICRAIADGYADPFFYFYSTIEVGNFVRVPPVSFKEFAGHPVLSLNNSVKAHFQGAGGQQFPLDDYLMLLGILSGKGFDISKLPIPPSHVFDLPEGLENERDVEIQLVEPLLRRLGYTDADWVRQMPLRMGRGERNFPDYAIDANTKRGEESAALLIEAKYEIATRQQREDAYLQGKSYALRLQAKAFVLAAKEGIWLYRQAEDFSAECCQHWSWKDMEHPDRFHEVSVLLGKARSRAVRSRRSR